MKFIVEIIEEEDGIIVDIEEGGQKTGIKIKHTSNNHRTALLNNVGRNIGDVLVERFDPENCQKYKLVDGIWGIVPATP